MSRFDSMCKAMLMRNTQAKSLCPSCHCPSDTLWPLCMAPVIPSMLLQAVTLNQGLPG